MYKAKFGFEFDTEAKAQEFNDGAFVCFSGCKDINDPPDEACKNCSLVEECMKCYPDIEEETNMQEIWLVYVVYQYDGYDDTEVYSLREKACRAADREVRKFKNEGYKVVEGYDDVSFDLLSSDGFGYLRLGNKDGEVEIIVEKKFLR